MRQCTAKKPRCKINYLLFLDLGILFIFEDILFALPLAILVVPPDVLLDILHALLEVHPLAICHLLCPLLFKDGLRIIKVLVSKPQNHDTCQSECVNIVNLCGYRIYIHSFLHANFNVLIRAGVEVAVHQYAWGAFIAGTRYQVH